jgi:hypothetical protein
MTTFTKEQLIEQAKSSIERYTKAVAGFPRHLNVAMDLELARIALASLEAEAEATNDVSGPLAHAYKELTPTFMRNHIGVFERYGIYPDGTAGIQSMRIALDGMERRAAMQGKAEPVSQPYKLPDGWVAVPVEPTAEMYDAGDRQLATKQVWDAMIAAAPQQEVK